jgi:hypothetical protein
VVHVVTFSNLFNAENHEKEHDTGGRSPVWLAHGLLPEGKHYGRCGYRRQCRQRQYDCHCHRLRNHSAYGCGRGRTIDEANTTDPAAGSGNVTDGKFGNQPPGEVTASFKQRYPSYTSGDWSMEDGRYSTTYMKEGKSYRASFSNTGEWIDTRNDVVLDDLPAPVKQAYQSSPYGSATNPRFTQIETAQYPVLYRADGQLNNQPFSLYFTPEGRTVELPHYRPRARLANASKKNPSPFVRRGFPCVSH